MSDTDKADHDRASSSSAVAKPPGVPVPVRGGANDAILKLGVFTVLMVAGPISTYFLSLKYIWGARGMTSAAISAAVVANLVIIAYIVTAIREDAADQKRQQSLRKKD